jgi:hypothetical protein
VKKHWPAFAILLYFLFWAARGLPMGFSYDDMMNLYTAWVRPLASLFVEVFTVWSNQSRPAGGLFYRVVYALGGFHPFPFHAACLALVLVNVILQYRFFLAVSESRGTAWAALLFGCYQGTMWDIYVNVGVVYDILCGTFYFAALFLYIHWRRNGAFGPLRIAAIVLLTFLALASKGMALALPVVLLLYEIVFHPPESLCKLRPWMLANAAKIGLPAVVCLAAAAGRLFLKGPLTGHPSYTPLFTLGRFLETTTAYTRLLFDGRVLLTPLAAVLFWIACVGLALLWRSRLMTFGALFFAIGMLPMSFIEPRTGGYVFYVPFVGLALYVGAAFSKLRERWRTPALPAVFVCAVVALHYSQTARLIRGRIGPGGEGAIEEAAKQLPRLCPRLAPGSRVLLVDSPFGIERHIPGFTLGLLYHSKTLHVVNARAENDPADLSGPFDHVFVYKDGIYSRGASR